MTLALANWMKLAWKEALKSPDPSTQNGAVLATYGTVRQETMACNEFPRGVQYLSERWERPAKYGWVEHAERNCLFSAARHGLSTYGSTLVVVWGACADCARAMIQCGVQELVTFEPDTHAHWDESVKVAMTMLQEANVKVTYLDGGLFRDAEPLRRNGELWLP